MVLVRPTLGTGQLALRELRQQHPQAWSQMSRRQVNTSVVRRPVVWTHLPGPVPYSQALELQEGMVASRLKAKDALADKANSMSAQERQSHILLAETDIVLFCEHAPVYTAGRREQDPAQLEEQAQKLTKATGASFVSTQRGGLTTFHGPGQLMCYPILDLEAMELPTRDYVHRLETCMRNVLSSLSPPVKTLEPTEDRVGLFTNASEKIASVGLHLQRRMSSHGFVLNVDSRCFPYFEHITACGLADVKPTSIQQEQERARQGQQGRQEDGQLQVPVTVEELVPRVAKELGAVLGRNMVKQDAMEGVDDMQAPADANTEVEHQTPGYRPQEV